MVRTWSHIIAVGRLIRLPNLLIILLTQSLIRWSLISPLLKANGMSLQMSHSLFVMLMLATILVTAGGYVINDYFDRKIDTVNHPEDVIVGRSISLRHTMTIHLVLTTLGVLLGIYGCLGRQILLFSVSCSCWEAEFYGFIQPPINARFSSATLLSH